MKKRSGFTIIEVALVIALTGIIFAAFVGSVSSSISAQRYKDSAQNFAEFIRSSYSAVINVQSEGTGNTKKAIYGRLLTFGEDDKNTIYSYDVLGKALGSNALKGSSSIESALRKVEANIMFDRDASCPDMRPSNVIKYNIIHGAWIETPELKSGHTDKKFTGSILIVRSPVSGVVTTLISDRVIEVQEALSHGACTAEDRDPLGTDPSIHPNPRAQVLKDFKAETINLCVASDDQPNGEVRRNIRIIKNGSNAAAVQIIDQDSEDNVCNK